MSDNSVVKPLNQIGTRAWEDLYMQRITSEFGCEIIKGEPFGMWLMRVSVKLCEATNGFTCTCETCGDMEPEWKSDRKRCLHHRCSVNGSGWCEEWTDKRRE